MTGLLLAAGAGRRAGGPKALRQHADGASWLARSAQVLLDGGCERVRVVLGSAAEQARRLLPAEPLADGRLVVVEAPDWAQGVSRSLLAGLTGLTRFTGVTGGSSDSCDAVLVHLVDLPDVDAPVVRRVLATADAGRGVLARACYAGQPGHPVLLGAGHLGPLTDELRVRDDGHVDVGAQAYLARFDVLLVECGDLATGCDQDVSG